MRSKIAVVLAAAAALSPCFAQADGLSYSYLDLAYVNTDIDGVDEDLDGFGLRGSLEVADNIFLFAGYADQSASVFGSDIDYQAYDIGGGYAWSFAPAADVYGRIAYVKAELDFPGGDVDDDGYSLGVGMRGRVAQQFELEGALNYVDDSDGGDDTSLGLGARWYFTDQLALGVEGEFGDDADTYGIGGRWTFAP